MAGIAALAKAVMGSQVMQPVINELVLHGIVNGLINQKEARLFYGRPLGEQIAKSIEPLGRLLGILPEEPPRANLPEDYYVTPSGITSTAGEQMTTNQGELAFVPQSQYDNANFDEPLYTPPRVPEQGNWTLQGGSNIPSQIAEQPEDRRIGLTPGQQYRMDAAERRVADETLLPRADFDYAVSENVEPLMGSGGPPGVVPGSGFWNPIYEPQIEWEPVSLPVPNLEENLSPAYSHGTTQSYEPGREDEEDEYAYFLSSPPQVPTIIMQRDEFQEMARGGAVNAQYNAPNKKHQEEVAKIKAQLMLRAVLMPDEYRKGGRVRLI